MNKKMKMRQAIAKDVLQQLKDKLLEPVKGTYINWRERLWSYVARHPGFTKPEITSAAIRSR